MHCAYLDCKRAVLFLYVPAVFLGRGVQELDSSYLQGRGKGDIGDGEIVRLDETVWNARLLAGRKAKPLVHWIFDFQIVVFMTSFPREICEYVFKYQPWWLAVTLTQNLSHIVTLVSPPKLLTTSPGS